MSDDYKPSDSTRMRPRPGAGRRGAGSGGGAGPSYGSGTAASPSYGHAASNTRQRDSYDLPSGPAIDQLEALGLGLSPLVRAAAPLLILSHRLRFSLQSPDVEGVRGQALEDLRRFEERARANGVATETAIAARYVLCAVIDEAVLATPWGVQSGWGENTLLVVLHREAWGGEKFFEMLERISVEPERHIELMELQYYAMAFGFCGKYQLLDRGHVRLAEVQTATYRKIRDIRGAAPAELSRHWRGVSDKRNPLIRYIPWWIVAATALALVAIAFVLCNALLDRYAAPVQEALAKSGLEGFTDVSAAPITESTGPTLTTLLANDIGNQTVSVEEQGGRTLLTLVAPTLFASGSAVVDPSYLDTLKHIADALDQIPGRILVIGHTDDQPLKSLHYRDNFELSRERAVSVAKLLKAALRDPARVQWTGVGSSQPRYKPESTPENRARNRRVEIVHVPDAALAATTVEGR
jgi:type VI secretion system protein ImpK